MKRMLFVLAVLTGVASVPAAAQTPSPAPRVEVGGHLGAFTITDFGDSDSTFLWGPRVTARVTDKLGVEFSLDLKTRSYPGGYRSLQGLYYITGRYLVHRRASGLQLFATFGGVGSFSRASWPAAAYVRPDGVRMVAPAGHYSRMQGPRAVVGGIAAEQPLNPHVAVRGSAEVVYGGGYALGIRFCGGLSVPIGRYRK